MGLSRVQATAAALANIPLFLGEFAPTYLEAPYVRDPSYPIGNVKRYGAKGDGVTDDTAAVQRAITAVVAIGTGQVRFPAGVFMWAAADNVAAIYLQSGIQIIGAGPGVTILRRIATSGAGEALRTDGVLGGARFTDVSVRNLTVDGNFAPVVTGAYTAGWNAMAFTNVDYIIVEDVEVMNCDNDGIVLEYCRWGTVRNCYVHDVAKDGIYFTGSDHCVADSNFLRHCNGGIALAAGWYCTLQGNTAQDSGFLGLLIGRGTYHSIVTDNIADGITGVAEAIGDLPFKADHPGGPAAYDGIIPWGTYHCQIVNNKFSKNAAQAGVQLVLVDDNIIAENEISWCPNYGMWLNSASRNLIMRNRVYNTGLLAGNRAGIILTNVGGTYPASDANRFEENELSDDTGTNAMQGIAIGAGITNTVLRRNRVNLAATVLPYNINSALKAPVREVTASTTMAIDDEHLRCDPTAGAIVVTLPSAILHWGKEITVIKSSASANTVTVTPAVGTINGAANKVLAAWAAARFRSNGTVWDAL
jgi:parallel beta-helix repeat protein